MAKSMVATVKMDEAQYETLESIAREEGMSPDAVASRLLIETLAAVDR